MSALAVAMIAETWLSDVLLYVGLAMTLAATAIYIRDGLGGSRQAGPSKLYLRIALYSLLRPRERNLKPPWKPSRT